MSRFQTLANNIRSPYRKESYKVDTNSLGLTQRRRLVMFSPRVTQSIAQVRLRGSSIVWLARDQGPQGHSPASGALVLFLPLNPLYGRMRLQSLPSPSTHNIARDNIQVIKDYFVEAGPNGTHPLSINFLDRVCVLCHLPWRLACLRGDLAKKRQRGGTHAFCRRRVDD